MDEELKEYLRGMEERLCGYIHDYIDERMHNAEVRIVRAFGAYQESEGVRLASDNSRN